MKPKCGAPGASRSFRTSEAALGGHPAFRNVRVTRNRYAGPCHLCGHQVPAGSGLVEKDRGTGRWIVIC